MAQRSFSKRLWYNSLQTALRLIFVVLYGYRCYGRRNLPDGGGALVLSNHQSHFDPALIGIAFDRRLNYLARKTLLNASLLGWLLTSVDTIAIDRDGFGLGGIKETLRRLKRNELVLMFPEGTRTRDGEVAPLKPGFCTLAKRSGAWLVPVAIEGAYSAWPRWRPWPRLGRIAVQFGEPISPAAMAGLDERALVAMVDDRIRACHAQVRARIRRVSNGG